MDKLLQTIETKHEKMVGFLENLVNIDSGYDSPEGVAKVARMIGDKLAEMDFAVEYIDVPGACTHLLAKKQGTGNKEVMIIGHMDTLFPIGTVAERPFTIKDGKAYGPGVLDMKGGIVAFLYAIKALNAAGYDSRPIKVLLAGDEEVLHAKSTAPDQLVAESQGYAAAFNAETGFLDNGIVVGRKGVARFTMEVSGVAAHAGNDPENGRSAILEMAHKIIGVQNLTDWDKGISFNVGVMQGGKTSTAVPDYAKIDIDVRYKDPDDLPWIQEQLRSVGEQTHVEGTTTKVAFMEGIKPMTTTDGVMKLFALVAKVSAENGFGAPYAKYVGGASDSAYTVIAGVPTVCAVGVKGGRNHSPEEFAVVETIFERAKLLVASVLELDADQE